MNKKNKSNPLLDGLPVIDNETNLSKQLNYDPLRDIDISSMGKFERREMLFSPDRPFATTQETLDVAINLIEIIRSSYDSRNPINTENRRKVLDMQMLAREEKLPESPMGLSMGYVIKGITGVGKSAILKRVITLFPEIIHHGKNPVAGWETQTQIPVLAISMPGEGSRGGFIEEILKQLDSKTGQSYSISYPKKYRSVDRLEVRIPSLLHRYHVGLLVVEELQAKNIVHSSQAKKMQLFLLSIMNAGIPLVLIGNPLGFTWLENSSQNQRRLYYRPAGYIHPMEIQDKKYNDDWDAVFKVIYSYYFLDEKPKGDKIQLSRALRSLSGGIPDLAMNLWVRAQDSVLMKKTGEESFGEDTLKAVYGSEKFDELRPVADGFTYRDPALLQSFDDIPVRVYMKRWGMLKTGSKFVDEDSSVLQDSVSQEGSSAKKKSEKSKHKAAQTRKKNKDKKRKEVEDELTNDDIRNKGIRALHLDGLNDVVK